MAIVKIDKTQVELRWNRKIWFEKGNYKGRIMEQKNYISENSGNFVVQLEWELYNTNPMEVGDKQYDIEGVTFTTWNVIRVWNKEAGEWDEVESQKKQAEFQENVLEKLAIDISEGWDSENPPSLKGICAHIDLYGKKENNTIKSKDADGKVKLVGQTDPVTGKPVESFQIQLKGIFGLCDEKPVNA